MSVLLMEIQREYQGYDLWSNWFWRICTFAYLLLTVKQLHLRFRHLLRVGGKFMKFFTQNIHNSMIIYLYSCNSKPYAVSIYFDTVLKNLHATLFHDSHDQTRPKKYHKNTHVIYYVLCFICIILCNRFVKNRLK